jgi:peptide deformylase
MPGRRPRPADPYAFPFRADRAVDSLVVSDHPALHGPAAQVGDLGVAGDPRLGRLIDRMIAVCAAAPGVGIAAPQVGVALRVAIVWPPSSDDGRDPDAPATRPAPIELVDPEILEEGDEVAWESEACLSLPCVRGLRVHRPDRIVVRAADRRGHVRMFSATGFIAEIFSHELDHLDGHLYPERAEELVYDPGFRPHDGDA